MENNPKAHDVPKPKKRNSPDSFIIAGAVLLAIAIFVYAASESSVWFAETELPGWVETDGVFLDFQLADSHKNSSSGNGWHDSWRVRFVYTLEYDVGGEKMTVTDEIKRSGSNSYIPESALVPPYHTGETTFVTYDPDDPSQYEIGSKESVAARRLDGAGELRFVYIPFGAFGVAMIIFGIWLIRRNRKMNGTSNREAAR